ncbi:DUF981 family protein [Planctomycetota bacterium]
MFKFSINKIAALVSLVVGPLLLLLSVKTIYVWPGQYNIKLVAVFIVLGLLFITVGILLIKEADRKSAEAIKDKL